MNFRKLELIEPQCKINKYGNMYMTCCLRFEEKKTICGEKKISRKSTPRLGAIIVAKCSENKWCRKSDGLPKSLKLKQSNVTIVRKSL